MKRICHVATSTLCALSLMACASLKTEPKGHTRDLAQVIDDQTLEFKAAQAVFNSDELWKSSNIEVIVFNGVVLLIGQTPTNSLKQQAFSVAKSIPNSKKIFNEIRVAAPTSSLTYLNDVTLTTKVKANLVNQSGFDASRVKVVTEDSEVFLLGLLTKAEAERVVETVRNVGGVKRVIQAFEITQ